MNIEVMWDVLLDSVKDTLTLVPFLLVTYLVMETLEHSTGGRAERIIRQAGKAGPAAGALLGALPQCGFSAMAGTLYAGRLITAGTLVAVILSTSDELIPVFLAYQAPIPELVGILVVKVVIGLVVGFAADAVLRALHRTGDGHPHIRELCERAHCHCGDIGTVGRDNLGEGAHVHSHDNDAVSGHVCAHEHGHACDSGSHESRWLHILRCALVHTVQVSGFIVAFTFVFGLLIEGIGEDALAALFAAQPLWATFVSALVGLIPNCAASVAIAELYLGGTLSYGPMLAGLLVSGGVGLLVLFRTNADMRQNVIVTCFIYVVGVLCGLMAGLVVG